MSGIARGAGVMVASMAAGASLTWSASISAAQSVTLDSFFDVHRDVYATHAAMGVALGGLALLIAIFTIVTQREKPHVIRATSLATLGMVTALIMGVLVIEPLARNMAGWSVATMPGDGAASVRLLSRLILARAIIEGLSASGFVMALVLDRPVRRTYTSIRPEVDEPAQTVFVPGR